MRNFKKEPLKWGEVPEYEDLYELYIKQNLSKTEVANMLGNKSGIKYLDVYNIKKSKELKNECRKRTTKEKYGCEHVSQLDMVKNKKKETCLKNYGTENPAQSDVVKDRMKQTLIERTGFDNAMKDEQIKEKQKNTMLKRYGEDNAGKVSDFKEKREATLKSRYGTEDIWKVEEIVEKRKLTNLERYGHEYLYGSTYFKEKREQTWKEKYGEDNPAKSEEVKQKLRERAPEMLQKMYKTKKKNNSFNTSKIQKKLELLLKTKFSSIEVEPEPTEKYPHYADFYVPELDLIIEYHGTWTHGGEPFDSNNKKHLEKLAKWQEKAKTSDYFKIAIKTWTQYDPSKVEDAEENNLNWLCFYTEADFMNWFNSL